MTKQVNIIESDVKDVTISQVSEKYNLTPDTIRYYEKIGLIPKVPRTKSGIRDFDETSCGWIEFIKCMRSSGMPIEALIEYVSLFKEGSKTLGRRKVLLVEQKEKLEKKKEELNATIKRLEYKIKIYDEIAEGKRKDFLDIP